MLDVTKSKVYYSFWNIYDVEILGVRSRGRIAVIGVQSCLKNTRNVNHSGTRGLTNFLILF